jgi:K+-transporting ATPase KdpF subunit
VQSSQCYPNLAGFLRNFYTVLASFYNIFIGLSLLCEQSYLESDDGYDGFSIFECNCSPLARHLCIGNRLREVGRSSMSAFYIVGAVVSVCLMVYLVVALLMAEDL